MSEHRVPMLGASWRRFEDPVRSRDPRVRAVVGALATLPSPEPRPEFRAELRAQLVAIAPRIVADSAPTAEAPMVDIVTGAQPARTSRARTGAPKHADGALARLRGISLGRPLAIAASVITVFALLFGGAVWMSQKALPGDTLYGLKRASESWELATAGSDTAKARDLLDFARTRADEVQGLLSRASASALGSGAQAGSVDQHTAELITATLSSADSDVRSASSLLGKQAVASRSTSPLSIMTDWAPGQLQRLRDIAAAMPDGSLRARAQSSAQVVAAAVHRAQALAPDVARGCASTSVTDALGPLPMGTCTTTGATPTDTPGHRPSRHATRHSGGQGGVGTADTSGAVVPGATGTTAPTSGGSTSSSPIVPMPTLPLPTSTASLPVSVTSCGLGVTLGPIGVGLGTCQTP
jgi:hypothetical protein